jgi:two-component system, NtrC family, response regulator HydG
VDYHGWYTPHARFAVSLPIKGVCPDLHEESKHHPDYQRYRSHLEAIFHSVEDGILTVDNEMHVIEANEAAVRICGIPPKGRQKETVGVDCSRKCSEVIEEAVSTHRPVHEYLIECDHKQRLHSIIGKNARMQEIYNLIEKLKDIDTTVLITGKSGTGKEVVASAIHYSGSRALDQSGRDKL